MRSKRWSPLSSRGFSYIEALAALMMTAMLMVGLTRTLSNVLESSDGVRTSHNAVEESRYVLERIVRAVSGSQRLMVPLAENPLTAHTESIRDPGVLAVTLDPARDLDADGFADADVDRDGRIDEDLAKDASADGQSGIMGIDDDGDGSVDEGDKEDDDEDGVANEDPIDGIDNDGDGSIDEDSDSDMNGDGADGIAGFDDDGDGLIDEDNPPNDDEDDLRDEDGWDAVVFYQSGADLVERMPVPWNESGDGSGSINGEDWIERVIATDVLQFYVERIPAPNGGPPLVNVLLTRSDADGQPHTLQTTIRLGGGP